MCVFLDGLTPLFALWHDCSHWGTNAITKVLIKTQHEQTNHINMKITSFLMTMAFASVMAGNGNKKNKDLPNGKPFQNLQDQIDAVTMQLDEYQDMMDERIQDLQDELDSLTIQVENNSGNITLIQQQQELQDELIATLTGNVAELVERVEQNEEDVEAALDLLESYVESAVTAIDARLDALEDDIEDLGDAIDTNAGNAAANAAAILQADVLLQQKADMLQAAIDAATSSGVANAAAIVELQNDLTAAQDELATKQHRVTQVCSPGYSIRAIAEDGTVTCEADDSTATLIGYTQYAYRQRSSTYTYVVAYCPSGYVMSGGGFYKSSTSMNVRYNKPRGTYSYTYAGWEVYAYTPVSGYVYAYARCLKSQ